MSRIFVFPGQGSQTIGMGRELAEAFPAARDVFAEIDDALSQKLFALMCDGPESDLNLTENTQPALMAVSVAVARVILAQTGKTLPQLASYVAGHSLGEYSALTVAGSLTVRDVAKLLKLRGQAMQRAVPVGQGAMAAILGLDLPDVQKIAADASAQVNNGEIVESANDNSSGQVVVSGHVAAVNAACALATSRGAKRALLLPVSAPFHCRLMQPAADAMQDALSNTDLKNPAVPVIANVTAQPVTDAAQILDLLVQQVTGMVRWRESVQTMKSLGITQACELGAGKVLSGLIKRIEPDIAQINAGTPAEIDALLKSLS
jgi:[acyl-carrier-protein] S-malonyltransferase